MSTVHVVGAAGFSGAQLAALVDAHPFFTLGQVTARGDAGRRIVDVAPEYRVQAVLQDLDLSEIVEGDFAAVCYPHAEVAAVVGELVDRGARVVDVSADHRLRECAPAARADCSRDLGGGIRSPLAARRFVPPTCWPSCTREGCRGRGPLLSSRSCGSANASMILPSCSSEQRGFRIRHCQTRPLGKQYIPYQTRLSHRLLQCGR